ncbi:hypothetical protein I79_004993 [Cricetulus griseus]|uniref:Uncharacterized protein n=1 Tax=Cricetulus griseus TaxID=10029 RepID=G3H400_CRIGR|nr:hypothetical protein I79_004993 [Cricetulus griseus]
MEGNQRFCPRGSWEDTKETSVRQDGEILSILLEYVSGRKGKRQGEQQMEQLGQKQNKR